MLRDCNNREDVRCGQVFLVISICYPLFEKLNEQKTKKNPSILVPNSWHDTWLQQWFQQRQVMHRCIRWFYVQWETFRQAGNFIITHTHSHITHHTHAHILYVRTCALCSVPIALAVLVPLFRGILHTWLATLCELSAIGKLWWWF